MVMYHSTMNADPSDNNVENNIETFLAIEISYVIILRKEDLFI